MGENTNNINNLLQNVSTIQKKYDDICTITGENFNIFSVLKMDSNEVRMHSAFIGELLNPKGSHGLKEVPLEIFISLLKSKFNQADTKEIGTNFNEDKFILDTESAVTTVEKYIGFTNEDKTEGGRIDIITEDKNKNAIIIENKIYANEQTNQLIRYNNYSKNAPILYLTLYGDAPTSHGKLKENIDYFNISYKDDIKNWLKLCLKEAVEFAMLREVIKQYLYLIKKLTNQTINQKMSEEIVKTMRLNIKSSFEISNNLNELRKSLFSSFIEKFLNMFSTEIEIKVDSEIWRKDKSIHIKNIIWENLNIEIYFLGENFTNVCIGLIPSLRGSKLDEQFKNKISDFLSNLNFGKNQNKGGWYFFHSFSVFANTNKAEFWENINDDEFVNKVFEDVNLLLNSIDEAYKKHYEEILKLN